MSRTVPIDQAGDALAKEARALLGTFLSEIRAESMDVVHDEAVRLVPVGETGAARYGLFPWRGRPTGRGHQGRGPFPKPDKAKAVQVARKARPEETAGLSFQASSISRDWDYAGLFLEARYGVLRRAAKKMRRRGRAIVAKAAKTAERRHG